MTTTSSNIADELILHKDLVEHQKKLIEALERKVEAYKDLAKLHSQQRDSYKSLYLKLKQIHSDYVIKVNNGLDSLLDTRIFKF